MEHKHSALIKYNFIFAYLVFIRSELQERQFYFNSDRIISTNTRIQDPLELEALCNEILNGIGKHLPSEARKFRIK